MTNEPVDLMDGRAPGQGPEAGASRDAAACGRLHDPIGLLPAATPDLPRRIDPPDRPGDAVARALGIPAGPVAVRLHRARGKRRDLPVEIWATCPGHGFLDGAWDRARARQQAAQPLTLGDQR